MRNQVREWQLQKEAIFIFIGINVYYKDVIARRLRVPENYKLWRGFKLTRVQTTGYLINKRYNDMTGRVGFSESQLFVI